MDRNEKNGERDYLQDTIRREMETAARMIPEEALRSRLEALFLANNPAKRKRQPTPFRRWTIVIVPTAALLAAFAVFTSIKTSRRPGLQENLRGTITRFFQNAPGIQAAADKNAPRREQPPRNSVSGAIRDYFLRTVLDSRQTGAADRELLRRAEREKSFPRLSIEETIRILFRDRSVEKTLSEFSKKNTEA